MYDALAIDKEEIEDCEAGNGG